MFAFNEPVKQKCSKCRRNYVVDHTCHAGTCGQCGLSCVDLRKHSCSCLRVTNFDRAKSVARAKTAGITCTRCADVHFINKNINGIKKFKGRQVCADCRDSSMDIQRHVTAARAALLDHDIETKQTDCALCARQLIDVTTCRRVRRFERDHLDVFTKTSSVIMLAHAGEPIATVIAEARKCRNLCVRCHATVTFAERESGILSCKRVIDTIAPDVVKRARTNTDELVQALLVRPVVVVAPPPVRTITVAPATIIVATTAVKNNVGIEGCL
jgi:hypothetical protein